MKSLLKGLLGVAVVAAIAIFWIIQPETPPERQAFINAQVLTMDADNRIAEAVLLEHDRIVAVGSNEEIQRQLDNNTLVHDLAGRTLMPGFVDAHGHFPGSGLSEVSANISSPPVGNINTIEELQARLKQQVDKTEEGEWVLGFGYDDTLLEGAQHPTRDQLDAVSTEHPIYILHVSGHMGVANSMALERVGYHSETPNPEGGVIVRDENGRLTGLVEETAHQILATSSLAMSAGDTYTLLTSAIDEYAAKGVTTAQSGAVDMTMLKGLSWAAKLGMVPFRLEIWPEDGQVREQVFNDGLTFDSYNSDKVRAKTIKIIADGSIQGFTGYLSHPYHTPFRGDEHYRGYPIMPREKLVDIVTRYHGLGYQMAIHGNGDASIDDILYAFDQAQKKHPVEDPRLILIHSQMARDDQLQEMKRLGITPSFFSAHTYYWGDRHRDIFMGPDRAMRMSPTRSAQDLDLRYSVHLDTPVVPMTPMLLVWSTVNRLSSSGAVIGADQRVSTMNALRAVTINAAWQIFQDKDLGSIEVGKIADLIVLDGDPLANPQRIRDIGVDETYVGGVNIFRRDPAQNLTASVAAN